MSLILTVLISVLTGLNTTAPSQTIVFTRTQKMILDPESAKWLKEKAHPAWQLEIEGVTDVVVKKPYAFYKGKVGNSHFHFLVKNGKLKKIKLTPAQLAKIFGLDVDDDADPFEVIELVGTDGETDLGYCSCGGATIEKEGDGCFFYSDGTAFIQCNGGCYGDLEGQSCGVTVIDFTSGQPPRKIIME